VAEPLTLNPGAQTDFVHDEELYTAYIGGLGSGKSYALLAKMLKYATQPKSGYAGPRCTIASATFPNLRDTIIPLMQELVAQTGVARWQRDYVKSEKRLHLPGNDADILFRSLDDPDTVLRGPELAFVGIDEGRNVSMYHWKLAVGRLRQKGYKRAAAVASTPFGFDWMYEVFHPDSEHRWANARWYGAPTHDNARNLPAEYIAALEAGYEGRFYDQEVLGKFVGVIEGGVFPMWEPQLDAVHDLTFDPTSPLYSFWDFGIADPGVCIFAQVKWHQKEADYPGQPGVKPLVPWLYILDIIEAKEWTAKDWAEAYHERIAEKFGGVRTAGDYGDPAGGNRNPSTGSSVILDLNAAGVPVSAAPRKPNDFAIRILNNMMAGHRVKVALPEAEQVSRAFTSHHWKTDPNGIRIGKEPVHDWTSHAVDAVRYGAAVLLQYNPRHEAPETWGVPKPDTYGHVFDQIVKAKGRDIPFLGRGGNGRKRVGFVPPTIVPRG
jgi:phage terminase large subunit